MNDKIRKYETWLLYDEVSKLQRINMYMRIFSPDHIVTQDLVAPLEPPVPVRHDADAQVLLLAANHVLAQPLLPLEQLRHPGVGSREQTNLTLQQSGVSRSL